MERIRNSRIILVFIFMVGISLFTMTGLAYCSNEQLIELIKETYSKWKRENPELATAFREEVDNLKVIEKERETEVNLEKLEVLEAIREQAAETKESNVAITDRKLNYPEDTTSVSSGGSDTPAPNPPAEVN